MVITEEWLRSNMNGGIGVTAEQIRALGFTWPPKKGWLKSVIGTEITDEQAEKFVNGRGKITKDTRNSEGVLVEVEKVCLAIKNLPAKEFLKSPLLAYGFKNPKKYGCAVCARKLNSIAKSGCINGLRYVSVCNECKSRFF